MNRKAALIFGLCLGCLMTEGVYHLYDYRPLMMVEIMQQPFGVNQNEHEETTDTRETYPEQQQQPKSSKEDGVPPKEYQQLLLLLERNIKELSEFVLFNYESEQKESASNSHLNFLESLVDRIRVLKFDINDLKTVDGYQSWREREAKELSDLVQHRMEALQNPPNCSEVKKLLCNIHTKQSGIGSIMHHMNICMMVAYGLGRTFVMRSKGWRYAKEGWESFMEPIGSCNATEDDDQVVEWPGSNDYEEETIFFPDYEEAEPRPPSMPQALPQDLADRLILLHGEPGVWWEGQVTQFLWKAKPFVQKEVEKIIHKMNLRSPVVGLHIRQLPMDKVPRETLPIPLEEYMKPVEDYYDALSLKGPVPVRRVFVVTDVLDVVSRLKEQYKAYTFIANVQDADLASLERRFSIESVIALYADIHLLAQSDFLVTTFSSNMGRMAYEVMQTLSPDGSRKAISMHMVYYVHGQWAMKAKSRYRHLPNKHNGVHFEVGDILEASQQRYTSYKLTVVYPLVNTTSYSEIDKTLHT